MFWVFTVYDWKSPDRLVLIGPSRSYFSLALVLFGLCECVCNNSLKPYHGEIIRPCFSDGHYRSTTCITSSLLISPNGCWGTHQESCFVNCTYVCVSVHVLDCVRVCANPHLNVRVQRLFFAWSYCSMCAISMCVSMHMLRVPACGVWGCVCMHVEWHLAKCGSEKRNIWLIIEVPWKKYDHESVLGLRDQR